MSQSEHHASFDEDDLLWSEQFGDHYFSRNDGRAECQHVFIAGNKLPERWATASNFAIGELGFGTGLNFLTTWQMWREHRRPGQHLHFHSVEAFPLDIDTAQLALNRWPQLQSLAAELLEKWQGLDKRCQMDQQTSLQVEFEQVEPALASFPTCNAWYLDGFAPARNPDMWSPAVMQGLADATEAGGTFASYTAAGWVRRNLQDAGFEVEKRPGFGTKRDMIAGYLP